jgi:mono/diheme cytochrome c family protein
MKIATGLLAAASLVSLASITANAFAQAAPETASSAGHVTGARPGDADGAFVSPFKFSEPDGEKIYRRVCAGCHMPDAKGAKGAGFYPALASNPKLEASGYPTTVVVHGLNGMPPFADAMTDQQIADVVNHVRTHFGNHYRDVVTPAEVKAVR